MSHEGGARPAMRQGRAHRSRPSLAGLMAVIAGLAIGLAIVRSSENASRGDQIFASVVFGLGGVSLVGVPMLLLARRRGLRTQGPGEHLWFATGISAWLLWPPIVVRQVQGRGTGDSATICFAYGTPLMALYVTLALLAGGQLRRRQRRRYVARSWLETFGLLLGMFWAATGLYVLALVYLDDFN